MYSSLLPLNSTLINTFPSTNTQPISQRAFKTRTKVFRVSCNAAPDDQNNNKLILPEPQKLVLPNVDRRNLLMGLSGLYTASNVISLPEAIADTITTPDITSKCNKEVSSGFIDSNRAIREKTCCPPRVGNNEIKNFKFPTENTVRLRWPAHKGTQDQVDKYRRAIQAMKDLPDDDPRSFVNQAKIHCAYCHGGYTQTVKAVKDGKPDEEFVIQIHNSWLFFPFHRWYLYFYERILGKLINDPTFALPYWKWDDPAGMQIPKIFTEDIFIDGKPNTLKQDVNRDLFHLPPEIVDLNWDGREKARSDEQQIACNLSKVYQDLVSNGCDPLSFFGGKYVAEAKDEDEAVEKKPATSSVGSVEAGSHTAVHRWVGNRNLPNNEDMGLFYSAGYDPLFYCHHANVDRMWKLWNDLRPENVEPNHAEWLDASYVFYDENKELVRVSNRDSACLKGLRYNYIEDSKEVFPWRKSRPARRNIVDQIGEDQGIKTVEETPFPLKLDMTRKVRVKRRAVQKTKEEKANMPNEVLLIEGIKFDCSKFVKFDVFVNDKLRKDIVATTCGPEYAGGFAQIPHGDVKKSAMSSAARFGLKELLQNTNTEGEEYARVILVPRAGCEDLTIDNICIIYP